MVCIPCIVIPFVLWFFHKYIQPYIAKVWNPWKKIEAKNDGGGDTSSSLKCPFNTKDSSSVTSEKNGDLSNGMVNGHTVTSGGDKKND